MTNAHKVAIALARSEKHALAGHPESPRRFEHIDLLQQQPLAARLLELPPAEAPLSAVLEVHPQPYIDALLSVCRSGGGMLDYGDTYATPGSFQAALTAAGSTLKLLDWTLLEPGRSGFALVRPPGHHATRTQAMGFCLLNNLAIAAAHAFTHDIQRIMVYDFDVHHGNGTQAIFDRNPALLYISTHQSGIYPGSGAVDDVGNGPGTGATINIPLPAGSGDTAFKQVFDAIIRPAAARFNPELILVSAGYDGHWHDPLASLRLTTAGYYDITSRLAGLANDNAAPLLFVLEGGYDPAALAVNVAASLAALAGLPCPAIETPAFPGEPNIEELLAALRRIHTLDG